MRNGSILVGGFLVVVTVMGCSGKTTQHPGTGGTGGSAGASGSAPDGGNVLVEQIRQTAIDKIDLLFMIDNSASMADKQEILSGAVPQLLNRLVNPDCVNLTTGVHTSGSATCPTGSVREFNPVNDIHIGVVTSSLGGHGADLCSAAATQWNPAQDDHGHLLATVRTGLASYENLGFLAWNPNDTAAIGDPAELVSAFEPYLGPNGAGEAGCGFEAQLEGWYRFLIDPDPPSQVTSSSGQATVSGPDLVTLEQRKSFLRADSLLTIIMLTDENDCSIVDGGIGWIVASSTFGTTQFHMPAATTDCAIDPNSPCCRSCGIKESVVPAGCVPLTQDANCSTGASLSATQDPLNLRCWDQKRRFGIDLLYPTSRYVTGLTSRTVTNRAGTSVPNPIFSDLSGTGVVPRDPSMVLVAGIVGVPWQDIADDASLTGAGLRYLTADELTAAGRWSVILGDPSASPATPPTDTLMVESNVPRDGSPYWPPGSTLGAPNSTDPQANVINGHEYTPNPTAGDLEYACIFPLATPVTCTSDNAACDCVPDTDGGTMAITAANRPLCQPPGGGPPGTTQYWAKAYPGLRELRVLRDFGSNSIVASICPKVTDPADTAFYGYNPAAAAVIDRFANVLAPRCLPRSLSLSCDGSLSCTVVEARPSGCDCARPGYAAEPVDSATNAAVARQLSASGVCGGTGQPSCNSWCICNLQQLQNDPQCTQDPSPPPSSAGYCYIDAAAGIGNPDLVAECPATQKRLLRFIGNNLPAQGSITFLACGPATACDAGP